MTAQVTWSGRVSVYEVGISLNQHDYHYCGGNKHFQHDNIMMMPIVGGALLRQIRIQMGKEVKRHKVSNCYLTPLNPDFFSLWIPLIVQDWQSSNALN